MTRRSATPPLTYRQATPEDVPLLAAWNHALIRDEGHRNAMSVAELAERMAGWLAGEYRAWLFILGDEPVAYVLVAERAEDVYLRQFYVVPERRRQGLGRRAIDLLCREILPASKRVTVECLVSNARGLAFWRAVGFTDYSLALEMPAGRREMG